MNFSFLSFDGVVDISGRFRVYDMEIEIGFVHRFRFVSSKSAIEIGLEPSPTKYPGRN